MHVRKAGGSARTLLAIMIVVGLTSTAQAAPILRQVNDFEAGTTQGWTNGGGATDPANVNTGGPAGTGDNFLRVTSRGGGGAGSRLAVFNRAGQWTGNYVTPGVTAIEMDLKNFGTTPLMMRVGLQESTGSRYASTTPFNLPADGLWHHATFNLSTGALTRSSGGTAIPTALTRISELRVIHSVAADFMADPIATSVGIDNVRAVPEPGAAGVLGVLAAAWLGRRRRR